MPPRIVHLPLALAAGDVELAICPASELSRDASPNPSSVNDLRLARQQFSYFVSARVSYSPPKDLKVHSEPPVTHMGYTGNTREK